MSASSPVSTFVSRFAGRLKFPRLLLLTTAVFVVDLVVPDILPFVDEILLALGVALLGSWREKKGEERLEPGAQDRAG